MRFPESPRVRYQRNPLVEVICQVRFSKILRIEKEPPYEVQEAIRSDYPDLEIAQGVEVAMPMAGNAPPIAISRGQAYEFLSKDRTWKLVLTGDFIALSTTAYTTWGIFREKFIRAVETITQKYTISSFTRIGLRYQDVVVRSELDLSGKPWVELLRHEFAGALVAKDFIEQDINEALSVITFSLGGDAGICRLRHGLARKGDSKELGYLIDADFFTERQTEVGNGGVILDDFNREAGRLFRWCIGNTLHGAMGPEPIK